MPTSSSQTALFERVDPTTVTSLFSGGQVRILVHGHVVYEYQEDDLTHRDLAVIGLRRIGLRGKRIAMVCRVSESEVTRVRRRYEKGGTAGLVRAPTREGLSPLSAEERSRAIAMRSAGASLDTVARTMRLSLPRVIATLDAEGLGSVGRGHRLRTHLPAQLPLTSVEPEPSPADEPAAEPETRPARDAEDDEELRPGMPLAAGTEPRSQYAGLVLLTSTLCDLGIVPALKVASAKRSDKAVYSAPTIAMTLCAGIAAGYHSLESLHERDAYGLGVVLGTERCPSVRTMHRALTQMTATYDRVALHGELARHLARRAPMDVRVFGVDIHFKTYTGKERIDKGWNSKRRLAEKGLADVVVTDAMGRAWFREPVPAGSHLSACLGPMAEQLRVALPETTVVLVSDRGGFDFDVLEKLNATGVKYIAWVPASVNLPDLATIAPAQDGIGGAVFEHPRMTHASRLIVQRDGDKLLPLCTNVDTSMDVVEVVETLRALRGMQENSFKSGRQRAGIDQLSDRGKATRAPDDRIIDNPEYVRLKEELEQLNETVSEIESCPERCTQRGKWTSEYVVAHLRQQTTQKQIRDVPARVERCAVEPDAQRAWLCTTKRDLVVPMRYLVDNAVRDLVDRLGDALSSTDREHDASTRARTLMALLQAPGTLRFEKRHVVVTIELPLPPAPHARIAQALEAMDELQPRFTDGVRTVRFRLAPRVTCGSIPLAPSPS